MKTQSIILRNLVIMTLSAPVSSLVSFITTMLIARSLKADGFGVYSQIFSIISIFQVLVEASRTFLIRDISRNPDNLRQIFGESKFFLWIVAVFCFVILIIILRWPGRDFPIPWTTIFAAGLGAVILMQALGYGIVFLATERMEFNALGSVIHKLLALLFIYTTITYHNSLLNIFIAFGLAHFCLWVIYHTIYNKFHGSYTLICNINSLIRMFNEVLVLGSTVIVRRLSWNIDVLLLSWILSSKAAGIFNGAYNIIFSINMIPWIATIAIFPRLSKLAAKDNGKLLKITVRSIIISQAIIIPFVLLSFPLSKHLILLLLGDGYIDSIPIMNILWLDLIFSFQVSFLFYYFVALGMEKHYFAATTAGLLVKVSIGPLLIKYFDTTGAAYNVFMADILITTLLYTFLKMNSTTLLQKAEDKQQTVN